MDVAMDGIVGSVIGGVITGGAVWVTIQSDRRSTREAELRAALAEVQALALQAGPKLINATADDEVFVTTHGLFVAVVHARSRAMKPAPKLDTELGDFLSAWNNASTADALSLARELGARMYAWLADPKVAAEMTPASWAGAAERSLETALAEFGEDPEEQTD